ncbi:type I secretion outer membrane protein, TolC family [Spongiibacter sp. IMCC21906]|jgi:outer membrane protein|uniref:TolC family outer membrane protein n=1 Tax=Spongiibacter sp. IMCC21906 TaxID=1620392 RepID=UPI00062DE654|nr:TolC family outer membrane protein [Spongiibacter sp. IMCC21906]AKH68305.1 type I secretion outer membrane protein, TolC family [Spongiibacter sp. IMCC21906]
MIVKRHPLYAAIMAATLFSQAFISPASQADTLLDVYELALQNDPVLKAAEANYRANIESENIARSSLLPQVVGEAYYEDAETDSNRKSTTIAPDGMGGTTAAIIDQSSNTDSETEAYSVSLNQAIFNLPAWFSFKAGKALSEQATAQLAYDQQDLIVRVSDAYFNVLRARENLDAAKAEEKAAQRQLEQTQQRFDVGLIAITDVHEARAVYDTIVAQRLGFEGTLAIARENLSTVTGQAHHNLWSLEDNFPIAMPEPADRAKWVDFALTNNHLLKAAGSGRDSAYQNARSKKMEHLPKITGSLIYSKQDLDGSTTFNPTSSFATPPDSYTETEAARITLTVPLFAGGGISAARRQAYEQYNAAQQNSISVQRQVIAGTRAQHIAVNTDVQTVKARKQNIISARSALDATEAGYEVGTRNIVDVLEAQRNLYAAIRDYTNARYDYVLDVLKLKQNAGTLSPADINELNKWLSAPTAPTVSDRVSS